MAVSTLRSLQVDQALREKREREERYAMLSGKLADDFDHAFGRQVDTRVDDRIDYRLSRTTGPFTRGRAEAPGAGEAARADGGAPQGE